MATLKQMKRGFTLIELLIVMSIIGVLASLLFANFSGLRERTRDTKRKSDLNQMKNALRLFYNDFQRYPEERPDGGTSYLIYGCGTFTYSPASGLTSNCSWGNTFSANNIVYMNKLPKDPLDSQVYQYHLKASDNDKFILGAKMENTGDPDIAKSQEQCDVSTAGASVSGPVMSTFFTQNDSVGFWYVVCPD